MRKIFLSLFMLLSLEHVAFCQISQGNGTVTNGSGLVIPQLVGTMAYFGTLTATGPTVVIPAVAGKRFFVTAIFASLRAGSSIAGGSNQAVVVQDGAVTILSNWPYIPATAATVQGELIIFNLTGLQYISQGVNQTLSVAMSSALTSGAIDIAVFGGYTTATP